MFSPRHLLTGLLLTSVLAACAGNADSTEAHPATGEPAPNAALQETGEAVKPPFDVSGELEGLLIVWFDEQGQHTAKARSEVPEARREHVRIDSLAVPPDQRLDGDHVYVADLRAPASAGGFAVHKHTRSWLDAHVQSLLPVPEEPSGDVTLYGASWCGACKQAKAYLESRNVPFVEKDIERDAAAKSEMEQKAQVAGKRPTGIPVIDFRGTLLLGFDQQAIAALIDQGDTKKPDPI